MTACDALPLPQPPLQYSLLNQTYSLAVLNHPLLIANMEQPLTGSFWLSLD